MQPGPKLNDQRHHATDRWDKPNGAASAQFAGVSPRGSRYGERVTRTSERLRSAQMRCFNA